MNIFKQLYSKYAGQISPTNCQYYTRVERVVNQLLMANKDLHQVFSKTWTMVILNDQKTINALVLPVSFETIEIILLVFNFLLHFRMESSLYFLVCWTFVKPMTSWQWFWHMKSLTVFSIIGYDAKIHRNHEMF